MPWKRMDVDEQRMQFVIRASSGTERMTALCRELGFRGPRVISGDSATGRPAA